ncbi:MAG: bifunctional DNA-formamidopyrimidine glycosylase/DNA-(apurinic or apyrimidinic site) lyase [bacterium]|nr:bifunctional DNA-formamidopyrimidine glycosylase/DNA-(apurinic or apyrimidinic site) lyase [bacterium]
MPELPEVETIVRDLEHRLKNKKLTGIKSLDKKVFRLTAAEAKKIIGQPVRSVERRAKMIIINLGRDNLLIHLKMTGQLVYKSKAAIIAGGHPIKLERQDLPNKFTRVIFKFSDQSALYFNDVRRFAWVKLASAAELASLKGKLGAEPLGSDFTLDYLKKVLARKRKTTIKQALIDQKFISGIGNIYADESLFAARIKPMRRAGSLEPNEVKKLWQAIPKILRLAIKHRGTSFSDYVDARGQAGNFIKYLKVYGRAGQPCQGCAGLVKKIKLGGRGTHWCDECQK